jgi:hypothetical protein
MVKNTYYLRTQRKSKISAPFFLTRAVKCNPNCKIVIIPHGRSCYPEYPKEKRTLNKKKTHSYFGKSNQYFQSYQMLATKYYFH